MRRVLRLSLFATVLASVSGIVAAWVLDPHVPYPFAFEMTMDSSVASEVKVYFDRGPGLSEAESSAHPAIVGRNQVHLPLPIGTYRMIRFDPLTRDGRIVFSDARIVGPGGTVVRSLPVEIFVPNEQIEDSGTTNGRRALTAKPGVNDPQLAFRFDPPLRLRIGLWPRLLLARRVVVPWFAGLWIAIFGISLAWSQRSRWIPPLERFAGLRPRTMIALCAVTSAVGSSYPVAFFGQSFVSPSNGAMLLYDGRPTVPGYNDRRAENIYGTDVGAMMWAHMPYTILESHALRRGELPLWNRYSSAGVTLFGQGQSMFGDPVQMLMLAAGGASWALDLKFLLAKALFACGIGWCVWALSRDLGISCLSALTGAFVAFFNCRLNHAVIFSFGYSPWVLVGWFEIMQADDHRAFRRGLMIWFVANWMLLTSGTVKEAYMLCASLNSTGALAFVLSPCPAAGAKLRRASVVILAGVGFALAAAPHWVTFLDSLATASTTYDIPRVYQVPGRWLLAIFDDIFYREYSEMYIATLPAANLLVLIGCLAAIAQPVRLIRNGATIAVAAGAIFALSLVFSGIPARWILQVPFVRNIYHINATFSGVAIVLISVLAGWGLASLRQRLREGSVWPVVAGMGLGFAVLVWAFFTSDGHQIWSPVFGRKNWWPIAPEFAVLTGYVALVPIAAALFLMAIVRRQHGRPTQPALVISLTIVALIMFARHGQHLAVVRTGRYFSVPGARGDLLKTSPAVEYLKSQTSAEPGRVIGTGFNLFAGFTNVYGLESVNGPDALQVKAYRELVDVSPIAIPNDWHFPPFFPANLEPRRPMLDFLNVRFVGTPSGTAGMPIGYRRVAALDLDIYESEHVWPRAFFTDQIETYSNPQDLVAKIQTAAPNQWFAAVNAQDISEPSVKQLLGSVSQPGRRANNVAACKYHQQTNTTSFSVTATGPGIIVLQETWLPDDFEARLNGRKVPYLRVNHAFKGVIVPAAGEYRVSFCYWPHRLTSLLIASAAGFLLFGTTVFVARWLIPPSSPRREFHSPRTDGARPE